eukprot:TRINITY_DN1229_c0_g1_i4.p1 TRINITY_DN1229_c0_g1~~TRINITY_DN1229_c0_g1_i4.p1  ORF type:complete len:309 (-),score=81.45 TRINITY_DN1229_c0_g1_i4:1281-2171(-)
MTGDGVLGGRPRVHRRRSAPAAILGSFAFLLTAFGAAAMWYHAPSWGGGASDGAGAATDAATMSPPRTGRSLLAPSADADLPAVVRAGGTTYGDLCEPADTFLKRPAALVLYVPGVLFTFLGLAIVTDEYFVPALERICDALQLSDDVAGATFAAAGSSAPELFTSLLAVFVTKDEVGVGTIVGSAVFNVLVIIGVSALLAGSVLELDWRPLVRDSAFLHPLYRRPPRAGALGDRGPSRLVGGAHHARHLLVLHPIHGVWQHAIHARHGALPFRGQEGRVGRGARSAGRQGARRRV